MSGTARLAVVLAAVVLHLPLQAEPRFVDAAAQAGIGFVHANGADGQRRIAETMGSGVAFFDADGDGRLDLYFANSAGPAALYANLGDGTFAERAKTAGVAASGFGMGVAVADYDNDGDDDFYITAFGPNLLYRNLGDGTFVEVADAAGVAGAGLSTGAAFGDLDLYVADYVRYGPDDHRSCTREGVPVYCGPEAFAPAPDALYRNEGDGTFTEIGHSAGLAPRTAKELGAVFSDLDDDGDLDLYVAGDRTANLLYRNQGGRLREEGLLVGAAFNDEGKAEAGMGLAIDDSDNDGRLDLFVTNFLWETNTLYRNEGAFFADVTSQTGLGAPSAPFLSWGTAFFDWDNDGDRDLFVANGHLDDNVALYENSTYAQTNQLFRNDGGIFVDVSRQAGPGLALQHVSRGAAVGDYDDDGDIDIAVANNGGPAVLLRNDGGNRHHWLAVRLRGRASNAGGIGAQVRLDTGGAVQLGEVRSGGSYLSHHDTRLFFGLGTHTLVQNLEIRWPSGACQVLEDLPANQVITVVEEAAP